jgi:site-specific DNA recombinase
MTTQPSSRSPRPGPEVGGGPLRDQNQLAIDRLAAEFHARLPRQQARQIGAIYARYSSRYQDSIADQVRTLLEAAVAQRIFVPRDSICFDLATRGTKERRPGLDRLRSLLAQKAPDVLLVFATNRLFRKTYKALQFVEEEVVERGIRCVFLKSGIDTADGDRWRMLLQVHAMTDESVVGMYAAHVRSAHEGLFDRGLVCGTIPFGYRGRELPGQLTKRHQPRRALEVDPAAAPWVERAFRWFVDDGLALAEIVRRFNGDPQVPPSPKGTTGRWTHGSIRYLLANPRYRGCWAYGAAENRWQSKKDYVRRVPRDRPLRSAQWEPLRIVADAVWYRAQSRLAEADRSAAGRKPKGGDPRSRPRLLHGLFACPTHDRILYVGGAHGQWLVCQACRQLPADRRPLYSLLPRALALTLTCRALAELVRGDAPLVAAVIAACRREAEALQRPDPDRLHGLTSRAEALRRQIDFILSNSGDTETDRQESAVKLRELRRQRAGLVAEIEALEAARARPAVVPTEAEVRQLLAGLEAILTSAGGHEGAEEGARVRQIIDLLTGGRIELVQRGEPRAHRGWLQGRFRLRLPEGLVESLTGAAAPAGPEGRLVAIDYRAPTPSEARADRVKELYDRGMPITAIAAELGIRRNLAARALDRWFERAGLPRPDGRSRRATLDRKHLRPPRFVELADEAKRLHDAGHLVEAIAARLDCSRPTAARAIKHWYGERGLPAPYLRLRGDRSAPGGVRPQAG